MGCGCRKNNSTKNDGKSELSRYKFLTPAQLELKRKQQEEEKKLLEDKTKRGN